MQNLTSASYHQQSLTMMMTAAAERQKQPELPEEEQLNCPRCDSPNTKFCYFNNYNLSQPRHFCKNCRRYWTKGGALRKIPVGGGSRKNNKRSGGSSSSSSSNTQTNKILAVSEQKKPDDDHCGTVSRLEEEKRISGQEMDSNRMLYGLPVGVDPSGGGGESFSSLLASNMRMAGITYETGSGWYPGISSGLPRSDDKWTEQSGEELNTHER